MTDAELDEACEAHLATKYGEKLDFALEAAVPTLLADGLVTRDDKARWPPSGWPCLQLHSTTGPKAQSQQAPC